MKTGQKPTFDFFRSLLSSNMVVPLLVIVLLFMTLSCNKKNNSIPSVAEVYEILNKQDFGNLILPITSVTPSANTDDLAAILPFLSDKLIVALGESTHGTSEFFTLRHRMIQYMVKQLNFRVLAIEANFSAVEAINDYIHGGPGTAKNAVENIKQSWVYNNLEFLQLIEWLREYNNGQSVVNKVSFYGFDAQHCEPSSKRVQSYISQYAPSYLTVFDTTAKHFLNDFEEYFATYTNDQLLKILPKSVADFQSRWSKVSTYFQNNKADLIAKSGDRAYDLALRHWEIVRQTFSRFIYVEDELKTFNHRDTSMADNVDWIKKFENNKKIILWAHAGHSGSDNSTTTQMGYHLKQRHQANYFSVGFFTDGGTVRVIHEVNGTPVLGEYKIDPKSEHVITQAFVKGNWLQFFLPMSAISGKPELKNLFSKSWKIYFIGSDIEKTTVEQNLGTAYDAIVFLNKTTATKP
ncbi:MAG: erythromycin esterase family protein [Bacteroidetes bacterium]|nr:erythromycin esterase family protein [Bacteroidota bacterium]